jgi:hypothetical protein
LKQKFIFFIFQFLVREMRERLAEKSLKKVDLTSRFFGFRVDFLFMNQFLGYLKALKGLYGSLGCFVVFLD